MAWESSPVALSPACEICNCTRLFRNAFKIKGTPEASVKRLNPVSAPRNRRIIGMAASSGRTSSPSDLGSPAAVADAASACPNVHRHENLDCDAIFSPNAGNSTPQKSGNARYTKTRLPLEEFDPNSQDSGYGGCGASVFSDSEKSNSCPGSSFQFAEPLGVAPRRLSLDSRSPMKSPVKSPLKSPIRGSPPRPRPHNSPSDCESPLRSPQRKRPALFRSISSGYDSNDDGFNDLIDMESFDAEMPGLPQGLASLLNGDIKPAQFLSGSRAPSCSPTSMDLDATTTIEEEEATTPEAQLLQQQQQQRRRRPAFGGLRRSLSLGGERLQQARSCLFRSPNATSSVARLGFDDSPRQRIDEDRLLASPPRKFKRPEPPVQHSPILIKRSRKCTSFSDVASAKLQLRELVQQDENAFHNSNTGCGLLSSPPPLQRSVSESEAHAHIKLAINRSTTDAGLTGDFSKSCALPLAMGQHEDLKSITVDTLSRLIKGDFNDKVSDFKIVDCRYPYEYEAGHIEGALNLFTKELIEEHLIEPLKHKTCVVEKDEETKRSILVFHCEFSWERGPNLSRTLRNLDRQINKERYPALHYPEIYLLHGGYQKFYKEKRELCSPQGYRPMRHPDHEADLRQFRSKSKSWQGEKTSRANVVTARANLKRLGF
ncbi:hypothetical protein QAD02_016099 [Eretmocerus hayati]|uniref:Uncharacterized protein n=1 Tax=Eretmocerus hayati TaxID=131215 RepID=A0ACC2PA46_9HYME|nr:hypothetical protein QAD02_016099 [Eretmocerus hayati]